MRRGLDYVIVGAGMFGSVFARRAAEAGRNVLVIDRRPHIAGNCFSEPVSGIEVHRYGPHIFHTNSPRVWAFLNRFTEFNSYRHRGLVRYDERLFSFPINLCTLHQLWGVKTPAEAQAKLDSLRIPSDSADNVRDWVISQVGEELYDIFVRGYTTKQWGRDPAELPAAIVRRIPIRWTWNDFYFDDAYQGIPIGGYTRMFENMLDHDLIRVETDVDFFEYRKELEATAALTVYTGKIDEYFNYRFGELEYRSLRFETKELRGDFQGAAIVNYGAVDVPYTRVVEHKHFALQSCEPTVITYEYPQKYAAGGEAYYPVRDDRNAALYERYRKLSDAAPVLFGGRLGTYQYYDMHQVAGQALAMADRLFEAQSDVRRAA